jgi:16S rRNA (cytosine967-C5)-methyltransferase
VAGKRDRPVRKADIKGLPARRAAVDILDRVLNAGDGLDQALSSSLAIGSMGQLAVRDRSLARQIVATTLRRWLQIEATLGAYLHTPIDERAGKVRLILASAVAQILFLRIPTHAVVNIAAALCAHERSGRGFKGLVNAVLRRVASEGEDLIAQQDAASMVLPEWLSLRWEKAYGTQAVREISECLLADPPLDLTIGASLACQDWARRLDGVIIAPGTVRLKKAGQIVQLDGYEEGAWWVQDVAAALPVRLLGDVNSLHVIDLCAAPGGKSAQLAAAGARVTAVDFDKYRMCRLSDNMKRLKLTVEQVVSDGVHWQPEQRADVVIIDAPCSATGIMRRHPDIAHRCKLEHVFSMAVVQKKLLMNAASMVKPGGTIIYCTCSLEYEEGEEQIKNFLACDATVERIKIDVNSAPGFEGALTENGEMRVLPNTLAVPGDNDGFFIAQLKKLPTNQQEKC